MGQNDARGARELEGQDVKFSAFQLFGHRELPDDFEQRYHSVWVDPPFPELADPARYGQYYRWTMDEAVHAARLGIDAVAFSEHHQSGYHTMPSPNTMAM